MIYCHLCCYYYYLHRTEQYLVLVLFAVCDAFDVDT